MRRGKGGVRDGNEFSRVTPSFHTLSAVCSGTAELVRVLHYIDWYWSVLVNFSF